MAEMLGFCPVISRSGPEKPLYGTKNRSQSPWNRPIWGAAREFDFRDEFAADSPLRLGVELALGHAEQRRPNLLCGPQSEKRHPCAARLDAGAAVAKCEGISRAGRAAFAEFDARSRDSYALKRKAAPGVDGVTWEDYEADLEPRLADLHGRVHRGAYRPQPSRRTYIPKADGKQRPLAIAALVDKIVQGATVLVLNAIYEVDFVGFSYGV